MRGAGRRIAAHTKVRRAAGFGTFCGVSLSLADAQMTFFAGRTGRERWKGWAGWKGWMAWLLGSVRPVTLRHCLLHTYILLDQWIRCTMYDAESSMIASMITTTIATTFPSEPSMDLRCPSHLNTRVPVLVGDLQ